MPHVFAQSFVSSLLSWRFFFLNFLFQINDNVIDIDEFAEALGLKVSSVLAKELFRSFDVTRYVF